MRALLQAHAPEIVAIAPARSASSSSAAAPATKPVGFWKPPCAALGSVRYTPIDVSAAALEMCRNTLEAIPGVDHCVSKTRAISPACVARLPLGEPNETVPGPVPRQHHRQLPAARRRAVPDRRPQRCSSTGDALLLGADLVKPVAATHRRLRRPRRSYRRLQPQPACAHQPRTRRQFRNPPFRARRPLRRHRIAAWKCISAPASANRAHRSVPPFVPFRRRRNHLDRIQP